jgi:hypothetical protein
VYQSKIYPYVKSFVEALNTFFIQITMYLDKELESILSYEDYPLNMLNIMITIMIKIYDKMYDVQNDATNAYGSAFNTWFYSSFMDS